MKSSLVPHKMCLDKVTYLSKIEANEEARYWKENAKYFESSALRKRSNLKAYKCGFCGKWHLGNSTRR